MEKLVKCSRGAWSLGFNDNAAFHINFSDAAGNTSNLSLYDLSGDEYNKIEEMFEKWLWNGSSGSVSCGFDKWSIGVSSNPKDVDLVASLVDPYLQGLITISFSRHPIDGFVKLPGLNRVVATKILNLFKEMKSQ